MITPSRTAKDSPFAKVLLAGGGIEPRRNVMRDDFAAVKAMLAGMAIMFGIFVALMWLVIGGR